MELGDIRREIGPKDDRAMYSRTLSTGYAVSIYPSGPSRELEAIAIGRRGGRAENAI